MTRLKRSNASHKRRQRSVGKGSQPTLRRSALYLALAASLGTAPYAVLAQESAESQSGETQTSQAADEEREDDEETGSAELESLEVRGYRRSVERSVAAKRASDSIIETVYAEDIGKLPDVSIAEALARLPGLTAQRTDGRAQTISIRGLGPDFSTALLNGREQVTTGDNRGVEFDQYPAELLGSVAVYKTPDATITGQGLAGTVDMRTIRPLDTTEDVLSVSARYEFTGEDSLNPDGDDDGYRANVIWIDRNADNTFGITLGAAIQSTPFQIERFNAWGYPGSGDGENQVPGGAKPFVQSNDLDRLGLIGTLEYAPNSNFSSTLDLSYSDFEEIQHLRGIEFPMFWSSAELQDDFTAEDGLIVEGTFDNVFGVMRNDLNKREAELFTSGWNTRFEFSELWGVETDLSYSRATRKDELIESYTGTGPAQSGTPDSLGFSIGGSGVFQFDPSLDYTDTGQFVITDPQGWGAGAQPNPLTQAGFINAPDTEDWLARGRLQFDRMFIDGPVSKATAGVDLARRDKQRQIRQTFLIPPDGATSAEIPQEALLGQDVSLNFIGIPGMLAYDPRFLLNNVYDQVPVELSSFNVPQDWEVREDVSTVYVKLDIDTFIGGVGVSGNVGMQAVHTDQESTGFRVAGDEELGAGTADGNFIPITDGDSYWRILPSLNLIFDFSENQKLRFGASRVMARPRMDQLNAGLSLNTNFTQLESTDPNQSFFSASGGNPKLRPIIANTVDLSWERYFADDAGYIALSAYYKDLEDFINPSDAFITDFSEFVDDFLTPEQQEQLGTPLGTTSGPTNNGSGYIRGAEFATSLPASLISDALDGFGTVFSVSYTDSKVTLGDNNDPITVPGLSEWVINTTLYYEKHGFQARLSHRYRDDFLSEVFGISATRVQRFAADESILDAQIGYDFTSGALDGLNVFLQANNLTDEPFTTFEGEDQRFVIDRQSFGRNFLVGATYRF
jgi:iron complex outermembrane receptor protein